MKDGESQNVKAYRDRCWQMLLARANEHCMMRDLATLRVLH